ncbi:5'-methylthioadenosine/S-adenosylhomocysteine nucleosidase [Archangium violaceum]|uniref:5'-methylthioadenosine/S-adenosylhomocysteine nucleosidase family protein n=1 Tax=Archangium violaceum TaxID=83451 RepID=UPI00193AE8C1|nr:5'-methylthioadenosine/S-adenosylhomocysteine nucleosidase [Archangium violaceum]QRK07833.1 5'-methylthioadenosine/S-adenosylhomocysteine nucleosidase [Archangium violaceum]
MRAHLEQLSEVVHEQGSIYKRGLFAARDGCWEVFVVETGPTNMPAATQTERAIGRFKPQVALFVGVAAGLKDVVLGDVVAASAVYNYESGKEAGKLRSRPRGVTSSHLLSERAREESSSKDWLRRIKDRQTELHPRAWRGPIVSGEKLLSDVQGDHYQFIREHYDDALAAEMEGSGFMVAADANRSVHAIVIRGVSDLVEGKSGSDAAGWQYIASRHASAFAFEVLSKLSAAQFASPSTENEDREAPAKPTTNEASSSSQDHGAPGSRKTGSSRGNFFFTLLALGAGALAYKLLVPRQPDIRTQLPVQHVQVGVGTPSRQQPPPSGQNPRPTRPRPSLIGPVRTIAELRSLTTVLPSSRASETMALTELAPGHLAFIQPWNISPTAKATSLRTSQNTFEVHRLGSGQFVLVGRISRQDEAELETGTRLLALQPDTGTDGQSIIGIPFEMIRSTQVQSGARDLKNLRVELTAP